MATLREELTESIDEAEWAWLAPHLARDVVIVVTGGLSLVEVGLAIAQDDSIAVGRWVTEQLLTKPSLEQLETWPQTKRFQALIVQPYVLVQEISS
ncbi:DUF2288 domain-containing protein [Alkalinema pantanalense CENA528]|uniref:DUF2288 domain-containing protein n=1 Tax=Alkalinema pantanalense TaxID=1620705 RepID=UPI003D6EBFC6